MIVVDTSALFAVVLDEPGAPACSDALEREPVLLISAGSLAEAYVAAQRRKLAGSLSILLEGLGLEVEPVNAVSAKQAGAAYAAWGKGIHPAGLNFGDCFAYALAKDRNLPLLFVGRDFARTDIRAAISQGA